MKIISKVTVLEAAKVRIERLFDEFEEVIVSFSGGKDSTICFFLTLEIARRRNRLPLKVMFIDQEAEWTETINYTRIIMNIPEVYPMWFQMPLRILNATSAKVPYLYCWEESKDGEWLREKEDISIKKNIYGTLDWYHLFTNIIDKEFADKSACFVGGLRAEESPSRFMAVTCSLKYKDISWGKILSKKLKHYTFYPIYDWNLVDVWKHIHDNNLPYNKVYDYFYMYGVPLRRMRVSNLHHETAVWSLFILQEIDGDLYNRMTKRLAGVDTAGKLTAKDFFIRKLPYMFGNWKEYRDFLAEKLISDKPFFDLIRSRAAKYDKIFEDNKPLQERAAQTLVQSIVCNDRERTKMKNFENAFVRFYVRNKDYQKSLKEKNYGTTKEVDSIKI